MAKTISDAHGAAYRLIGVDKILLTNDDNIADFGNLIGGYRVYAGEGDDHIRMGGGNDFVDAGGGNDRVSTSYGNDTIFGGDGDDALNGGRGNDVLNGGDGMDVLFGAAHMGIETDNDILTGGAGADAFYFGTANVGCDIITDYDKTQDVIAIEHVDLLGTRLRQVGADVVISFEPMLDGTLGSITVQNAVVSDLHLIATSDTQVFLQDFYAGLIV